jgi:hypothetical protein
MSNATGLRARSGAPASGGGMSILTADGAHVEFGGKGTALAAPTLVNSSASSSSSSSAGNASAFARQTPVNADVESGLGGGGGGSNAASALANNPQQVGFSANLLGNNFKDSTYAALIEPWLSKPSSGKAAGKNSWILWWLHLGLAAIYLLMALGIFLWALFGTKKRIGMYTDFRQWNSGLSVWEISLRHLFDLRADLLLVLTPLVLSVYHASWLFTITRDWHEGFLMQGRNPIRNLVHMLAFGIVMTVLYIVCGSNLITPLVLVFCSYVAHHALMMATEYANPPHAGVGDNRLKVYWTPLLFAWMFVVGILVLCTIYLVKCIQSEADEVPLYAYFFLGFVWVFTVADIGVYALYYLLSWIQNYMMVEVPKIGIEFLLALTIIIPMAGWTA